MPDGHIETFEAGLLQSRYVFQDSRGQALRSCHAVDVHFFSFNLRGCVGRLIAQDVDLTANQVSQRGRSSFVGNRSHVNLQGVLQHQTAQMRCRTHPSITEIDLALVLV